MRNVIGDDLPEPCNARLDGLLAGVCEAQAHCVEPAAIDMERTTGHVGDFHLQGLGKHPCRIDMRWQFKPEKHAACRLGVLHLRREWAAIAACMVCACRE